MNSIATTCFQHLATCLSAGDLEEMKELHIEEIKDFFIKILDRKLNRDFLRHCLQGEGSYFELTTEISDTLAYAYDDYYDDIDYEYGVTELPTELGSESNLKSKTEDVLSETVVRIASRGKVDEEKLETNYGDIKHTFRWLLFLCSILTIFLLI